jgi:pimeloyl-ACP methyl ester carboxylesterase
MVALVLAHSPLTGPEAWGHLPATLRELGTRVVVLDVDDRTPPFAASYVADAARQITGAGLDEPVVLVAHSGGGYLLPQIGATQRAARRTVGGYVFVDAGVPHARGATRLGLLRAEDTDFAAELQALLVAGGVFPTWTDDDLRELIPDDGVRRGLVASLRPRGRDFFVEPLPCPPDWPDAPCGFIKLSAAYEVPARVARSRGWTVRDAPANQPGGHFAACADPVGVAGMLREVTSALGA